MRGHVSGAGNRGVGRGKQQSWGHLCQSVSLKGKNPTSGGESSRGRAKVAAGSLPNPGGVALPLPDVSLLDTACGFLKAAFNCISHCPPGTLYSQLCQLLALATGDQDPVSTAYLLSESVSVTMRHQLLSIVHRKLQ